MNCRYAGMTLPLSFRQLRGSPGFFAVCVLTLGIGIGLSTTVFSVVDGVLLRPLQFPDSERIVVLGTRFLKTGRDHPRLTGADWLDIQKSTNALEATTLYGGGSMGVQVAGQAEFTGVQFVTGDYAKVFNIAPSAGRWFGTDADSRLAVVTSGFALRHFGSIGSAVGQSVTVENTVYEITGVVARAYPHDASLWLQIPRKLENPNRSAYNYRVLAKLKPDSSVEVAQAEFTAIGARLAATYSESRQKSFYVRGLQDHLVGKTRSMLWILLGAVTLVLLISCANVANLLLARAGTRSAEFAVRSAVGASRGQLIRQMLSECVTIGLLAGALGLLLAEAGVSALSRVAAAALPRWEDVQVDWRIFLFAASLSLLAAIVAGVVPAWRASHVDVTLGLRIGGAKGVLGGRAGNFRSLLIVAQIAFSVALTISAGLLLRSFLQLSAAPLGYQPDSVLVLYTHLPAKTEAEYLGVQPRAERLYAGIAALPGVVAVSAAMGLPAGTYGSNGSYAVEGKPRSDGQAGFRLAQPGYFAALDVPLKLGRDFTAQDQYPAEPVTIISESLARQTFAGEDPVGRRIKCGLDRDVWMRVVGVVGDVRSGSPALPPQPELYMPLAQHPYFANEQQVVIRTLVPPTSLIQSVRQTVARLEPLVPSRFEVFRESVDATIGLERFRTQLFLLFAGAALLVALAGVYSVTAYLVERRLPEFGLRLALGATPAAITQSILAGTGRLLLLGLALGAALALIAGQWLESLLYGIPSRDPASYAVALVLVPVVTLAAAWWPAFRAGKADPQQLLR